MRISFIVVVVSLLLIYASYLKWFTAGVNSIPRPPTQFRQFSPALLIRGGSNYTQHLSFVITEHMELVLCQKNFPTARGGRQSRVGSPFFAPFLPRN